MLAWWGILENAVTKNFKNKLKIKLDLVYIFIRNNSRNYINEVSKFISKKNQGSNILENSIIKYEIIS